MCNTLYQLYLFSAAAPFSGTINLLELLMCDCINRSLTMTLGGSWLLTRNDSVLLFYFQSNKFHLSCKLTLYVFLSTFLLRTLFIPIEPSHFLIPQNLLDVCFLHRCCCKSFYQYYLYHMCCHQNFLASNVHKINEIDLLLYDTKICKDLLKTDWSFSLSIQKFLLLQYVYYFIKII